MLTVHLEPEITRLLGIMHMHVSGPVWPSLVVPAWYAVSVPQNAVSVIQFGLTDKAYAMDLYIQVHGVCSGVIVQELCESRDGRPGLSVLTSLLASVDVKLY